MNVSGGLPGGSLEPQDYAALTEQFIDSETAKQSMFRRVDNFTGRDRVGRSDDSGRYKGIAIPYFRPGEEQVREYRIRRDHPEFENGKPKGKYMAPPSGGSFLYFAAGTAPEWMTEPTLPIVLTEGEFKAVALFRAANNGLGDAAEGPRFLPVGLSGVWN